MKGHAAPAAVVGVTIGMVTLAATAVGARLYARIRLVHNAGMDDGFIVGSLIFSIATTITMCLQVKWGMGRHIYTLTLNDAVESQIPFYISIWVYNLGMSCTKFSILLQYLRIFPQQWFRNTCYAMIVVVSIYTAWTFFSAVFACWPISYFWTQVADPNSGGRCLPRFKVWFANAAMNIATDVAVGLIPIPVIRELELAKRQKFALMLVFGLGLFTCVVSGLRFQALWIVRQNFDKDVTWENPLAAIWSSVEMNTGILCSCLPTLRRLFARWFPNLLGSTQRSAGPSANKEAQSGDTTSGKTPSNDLTGQLTQESCSSRKKSSFDALGWGLSGKSPSLQNTLVCGRDGSSEELEMDNVTTAPEGEIQVTTVVEQDVEKLHGWYDDTSTRGFLPSRE